MVKEHPNHISLGIGMMMIAALMAKVTELEAKQ